MNNLYPYTNEDRLCSPNSYMYTPFVGEQFFIAYATVRTQALNAFTIRCEKSPPIILAQTIQARLIKAQSLLLNHPWDIHSDHNFFALTKTTTKSIKSVDIPDITAHFSLIPILEELLTGYSDNIPKIATTLEYLAERFELGKCLRTEYNKKNRELGEKLHNPLYYAQFALLLGNHCMLHFDYKILNTLLKTMDTLCSISKKVEYNTSTAIYAVAALVLECAAVTKVLQEHHQ